MGKKGASASVPPPSAFSDVDRWEGEFWAFSAQIPVPTRDYGLITLTPWGTQRYLIRTMLELHAWKGIRQFQISPKGRQVGATEILRQFGLFLMLKFPGLQGAYVADCDENRDLGRDSMMQMSLGFPGAPTARLNNKFQIAWDNASRYLFQTAGPRSGSRLGVGKGVALIHGTEWPIWSTGPAMTYLRSAFSDVHQAAMAWWEGTGRGRNFAYDEWIKADSGELVGTANIFLGWWLREDYRKERGTPEFQRYWDGHLTAQERRWQKELGKRYHRTLTPEQLAWRRWFVVEKAAGDMRFADQEMPTLPEDAFEATGLSFLSVQAIRRCRKTVTAASAPAYWRYEFGQHIEDTRLRKTTALHASLRLWEEPRPAEAYALAAVPAFSTNENCPAHVCSVWKGTRDSLEQVAAFASEECGMQQMAWICAGLVGTYQVRRRAFILETVGVGAGVLQELQRLMATGWGTAKRPALHDLIGGIRHYIYRRPDSLTSSAALQWRSSTDLREWLMNRLRDQIANGSVIIRDAETLKELERIRQDGDQFVPEGGKDGQEHRVMAAALAVEAWSKQLRPFFERVQGRSSATNATERLVARFFDQLRAAPSRQAGRVVVG